MLTLNLVSALAAFHLAQAACPYMGSEARDLPADHPKIRRDAPKATEEFLAQYEIDDSDVYLTSDVGGPISDQNSLSLGENGPTLLEDFIFRQKVSYTDIGKHLNTYYGR